MIRKLLGSGAVVDLLAPEPALIDPVLDIVVPLARLARFDGQLPLGIANGGYSVAQHSVLGADAILAETGRQDAALAFLLHDAHEVLTGDITTPVVRAIDAIAVGGVDVGGWETFGREGLVQAAIDALKLRCDAAIHARLRLAWPWPAEIAAIVAKMDRRMLRAELIRLGRVSTGGFVSIGAEAIGRERPVPLADARFLPLQPALARDEFIARLDRWHPEGEGWRRAAKAEGLRPRPEGPHPGPLPGGEGEGERAAAGAVLPAGEAS